MTVRPVLFVTNIVAPERVGAFQALHERERIELALFGGRLHHATGQVDEVPTPHRQIEQREVFGLAASGAYRAVVCGTAGRVALPHAWLGARRAGVPFVLWSALWSHPRTPAHVVAGAPLLNLLYRRADAVATYGPHVSEFVRARGARRVSEAPQAVDGAFWGEKVAQPRRAAPFTALAVGRAARYKGEPELLAAWRLTGLSPPDSALVLAGDRGDAAPPPDGVEATGALAPEPLRDLYAGSDVLVMAAIESRHGKEPWGLVANEAMSQGLPVIATDAVGAAAGGLVVDGQTGLVVPAGDAPALAAAISRLREDAPLRARLGESARSRVGGYTHEAWAAGISRALRLAGVPPATAGSGEPAL